MNYQEYRAAKEAFLQTDPLRLDCMNTQKALSGLVPAIPQTTEEYSLPEALAAWQEVTGFDLQHLESIPGTGVRELLAQLIEQLKQAEAEFLFPCDVYPVYHRLLGDYPARTYHTFPDWEWEVLSATSEQRQVLLLTQPAVPVGRYLSAAEITTVQNWLAADARRLLIVDAAYAYEPNHSIYAKLLASNQCLCLFSLSKPWLLPEHWGLAVGPTELLESVSLSPGEFSTNWVPALLQNTGLPARLRNLFHQEWKRLSAAIHEFVPDWKPPDSGYYATVNLPFEQLLQTHNVLGVPATVFGSDRSDVTVISCLFHIQRGLTDG